MNDIPQNSMPAVLTFSDLSVSTETGKANEKIILNKVSGVVCAGLTAVMGPTASGKSSLLNALVGHLPAGLRVSSGDIKINGKQFTSQEVHFGHCLQVDELNGRLTVLETLMYAADRVLFQQSRVVLLELRSSEGVGRRGCHTSRARQCGGCASAEAARAMETHAASCAAPRRRACCSPSPWPTLHTQQGEERVTAWCGRVSQRRNGTAACGHHTALAGTHPC